MTPSRSTHGPVEAASEPDACRQPRADSLRNRARLLEAAEEVFGAEGLGVPIDRIAERAGVGVGTLYRHFPNKEALFEAIVLQHFERVLEHARGCRDAEDPAAALFGLLQSMVTTAVSKRDLAEALVGAGVDFKAAAGARKQELEGIIAALLSRAQEQGTLRSDVSAVDLMALVTGACMQVDRAATTPIGSPLTMLTVVCDGLRARA